METIKLLYGTASRYYLAGGWKIFIWMILWSLVAYSVPWLVFGNINDALLFGDISWLSNFRQYAIASGIYTNVVMLFAAMSTVFMGFAVVREEDVPFLKFGVYGILHPLRTLAFGLIWLIITVLIGLMCYGIVCFFGIVLQSVAAMLALIVAILIGYLVVGYWWLMSIFTAVGDDTVPVVRSFSTGWGLFKKTILSCTLRMLPALAVLIVLGIGLYVASSNYVKPRTMEYQLASQAVMMHAMDEAESAQYGGRISNIHKFTPKMPRYDGDPELYRSMLADYAVERMTADAKRNGGVVPSLVTEYLAYRDAQGHYGILLFMLAIIFSLLMPYVLILFTLCYEDLSDESYVKTKNDVEPDPNPNGVLMHGESAPLPEPDMTRQSLSGVDPASVPSAESLLSLKAISSSKLRPVDRSNASDSGAPSAESLLSLKAISASELKPVSISKSSNSGVPSAESLLSMKAISASKLKPAESSKASESSEAAAPSESSEPPVVAEDGGRPDAIDPGFDLKF